jgi:hypothetical protein
MTAPKQLTATEVFALAFEAERAGDQQRSGDLYGAINQAGLLMEACANHAIALQFRCALGEAEDALRAGLRLLPGDPDLTTRLAHALLLRGDYENGLSLHEYRPVEITGSVRGRPKLRTPEWDGGPVRSLLIVLEQGLGDQIMMARYAKILQQRGVDVTLTCAPTLARLFEQLGVRAVPATGSLDVHSEAWALQMSLPYLLGTRVETIPEAPYLPSPAGGQGIGLMSQGNPLQALDHRRSLPPDMAAELAQLPGVRSLAPEDTGARDFLDTAHIIDGLALVITVDTAVAHLAGAMGKPTWLLLPSLADWRWLRDREDSPWYPSMRLFRQAAPGDWRGVIDRVKDELTKDGSHPARSCSLSGS